MTHVGIGQGHQPFVEHRRSLRHGRVGVQHRGQHFEFYVDEPQSLLRNRGRGCRHCGYGVAPVEGFFPGHDVAAVKTVVHGPAFLLVGDLCGDVGEVGGGRDCLDAGQSQRSCSVDVFDYGVRVGAAEYLALQQSRRVYVGGIAGPSCYFVVAVVADGAGADYTEFPLSGRGVTLVDSHGSPPCGRSNTARMS